MFGPPKRGSKKDSSDLLHRSLEQEIVDPRNGCSLKLLNWSITNSFVIILHFGHSNNWMQEIKTRSSDLKILIQLK